jgi:hypothetical protein
MRKNAFNRAKNNNLEDCEPRIFNLHALEERLDNW